MKLNAFLAVPALLGALLLSACGEKAADVAEPAADATTEAMPEAAATDAAPAAEAAPAEAGGYEPTAEERIPGETR